MSKLKYYASATSNGHGNWMEPLGFEPTKKLQDADVIIFGGGADIEPTTYGEEKSNCTHASPAREAAEKDDFRKGVALGKKFVGICRGHQLLCALAGGKLIQDVTNHTGSHSMSTFDNNEMEVNSLHHQMISPYNLKESDYRILAWSTRRISDHYIGGKNKKLFLPIQFREIESIYFPKIQAIGFQYHPEMMYGGWKSMNSAVDWTQQTFMKFFENKI